VRDGDQARTGDPSTALLSAVAFEDRLEAFSENIKIGEKTIRYADAGCGDAIVLCHGIPLSMSTWQDMFFLLAVRYRVIAVDMPGYGRSTKFPGDYSLAALSGTLAQLCAHLDLNKVHVVGSSFGAAVAITLAQENPTLVQRLVLINSVGIAGGTHSLERIVRSGLVRHLVSGALLQRRVGRAIFRNKLRASYATLEPDEALVDHYYELLLRGSGERSFLKTLQQFDERALQRRLSDVAHPVLSIWGEKDKVLPLSKAFGVQKLLPRCWSTVIADVGHLPHEEKPHDCASLIDSFFRMPLH
jgi:pimeloyl-ACP methyl ester carboxylesterase